MAKCETNTFLFVQLLRATWNYILHACPELIISGLQFPAIHRARNSCPKTHRKEKSQHLQWSTLEKEEKKNESKHCFISASHAFLVSTIVSRLTALEEDEKNKAIETFLFFYLSWESGNLSPPVLTGEVIIKVFEYENWRARYLITFFFFFSFDAQRCHSGVDTLQSGRFPLFCLHIYH